MYCFRFNPLFVTFTNKTEKKMKKASEYSGLSGHVVAIKPKDIMKTVIILGPLFTQAERIWNRLLKQALEKESHGKLKVTLPQDKAKKFFTPEGLNFTGLMENCLKNAESHDIAIAVLDGSDADSGTCVEIGYRKGRNRNLKIIGVRTDFRASEDNGLNAMLRICDRIIYFPSFNENVKKLAREIVDAMQIIT